MKDRPNGRNSVTGFSTAKIKKMKNTKKHPDFTNTKHFRAMIKDRRMNEPTKLLFIKYYNKGAIDCINGLELDDYPKKCPFLIEAWSDGWHSQQPDEYYYKTGDEIEVVEDLDLIEVSTKKRGHFKTTPYEKRVMQKKNYKSIKDNTEFLEKRRLRAKLQYDSKRKKPYKLECLTFEPIFVISVSIILSQYFKNDCLLTTLIGSFISFISPVSLVKFSMAVSICLLICL